VRPHPSAHFDRSGEGCASGRYFPAVGRDGRNPDALSPDISWVFYGANGDDVFEPGILPVGVNSLAGVESTSFI
jgi:hypothetical protein